jgi:hypothetical protein
VADDLLKLRGPTEVIQGHVPRVAGSLPVMIEATGAKVDWRSE